MNENLNLVEILRDCPEGTKLYSPIIGEVEFKCIDYCEINYCEYPIITRCKNGDHTLSFTKEGLFYSEGVQGECIMLFPSKDQRDWSKFKVKSNKQKFDPKTLQPFDKVLVRDSDVVDWKVQLFSRIIEDEEFYPYVCINESYKYCIPYNDDTKHLVGTKEEAQEFYRYWED